MSRLGGGKAVRAQPAGLDVIRQAHVRKITPQPSEHQPE